MIKLPKRTSPIGEYVEPYDMIYPRLPWINLLSPMKSLGRYALFVPTNTELTIDSALGVKYNSIGAMVMSNLLLHREDRKVVAETRGAITIRDYPFKTEGRQSPRTLVYFLLFERYVKDTSFRAAVKRASVLNIHFDMYSNEKPGYATVRYYTNWYPEVLNRLIYMDRTGNANHVLKRTALDTKWYTAFIFCSEEEFSESYINLIEQYEAIKNTPVFEKVSVAV